jgi:predicted outer membrane repeat protein
MAPAGVFSGRPNSGATARDLCVTIRNGLAGVTVRNGIVSKDRERERRNGGISDWSRGGGIAVRDGSLTITDSTVTGNAATHGGGIWKRSSGKLAISRSVISGNMASDDGGGVSATGILTLSESTVTDNSGGNGGGIYSSGDFTLLDSTVSGNTAKDGGGAYLIWFGSLNAHGGTIYDSTVEGNTARYEGGGIWSAAPLTLFDSSVKENAAATDDIYVPRRCNNCTPGSGSFDEIVTAAGETLKHAAKAYAIGDYLKALDLRLALAREGSGEAHIRLGWMLYGGDGVDQSFEGAAH